MMTLIAVILFLSTWSVLTLVYAFYPKRLGKLGNWMNVYGWINKWDMFTLYHSNSTKNEIYFRDQDEVNKIGDWQKLDLSNTSKTIFILNPKERVISFFNRSIRQLKKRKTPEEKYSPDEPVFKFLCSVVCDLQKETTTQKRQIKVIQVSYEGKNIELVRSEFLEVK